MDAANEYPPDLDEFLSKPWDIDALRAVARGKGKTPAGMAPGLLNEVKRSERDAADWDALPQEERDRRMQEHENRMEAIKAGRLS
jgi:hypothetical protein